MRKMETDRENLRIRDPFVYADKASGWYYLYGTTASRAFGVYKSRDLQRFEYKEIFNGEKTDFWGTHDYWAAEMHPYGGKYYLFATVKAEGQRRATHIFVCDTPDGDFTPLSSDPVTPKEWECLDGTLCIEEGAPYIVFCHEWVQCKDGEICALRLKEDLTAPVGEPFLLFKASDNPFVTEYEKGTGNYVTDGPFLWREEGKLKMIWSSFKNGKYGIFGASASGLRGVWEHTDDLVDFDGGHAMLFHTFDGKRKLAMHAPNVYPDERPRFLEVDIKF